MSKTNLARRFMAGGAVFCAMASPATAQLRHLDRTEAWSAFVARAPDTGVLLCGLRTDLPDNRTLFFRQVQGGTLGLGLAMRPTWRVPAGTRSDVRVQVDQHPGWEAAASPSTSGRGLVWAIPAAPWKTWLEQAPAATSLRVAFLHGDEPEWAPRVDGLSAVLPIFTDCVKRINAGEPMGVPAPTQPFDPSARAKAPPRTLTIGFGTP